MARKQTTEAPAAAQPQPEYQIVRHSRSWKVIDPEGELVCITLYRKGAREVIRRLQLAA